jgi:hypothetical protein
MAPRASVRAACLTLTNPRPIRCSSSAAPNPPAEVRRRAGAHSVARGSVDYESSLKVPPKMSELPNVAGH